MTRLTSITPGAKERISANAGRLLAAKSIDVAEAVEIAVAIENRVTELCRPEAKEAK